MTDIDEMMNLLDEFGCKYKKIPIVKMAKKETTGYSIDISTKILILMVEFASILT